MKFNKKAFNILNRDEKAALSLHNVHNKSTWQAGEILKKSHYKYLEIKQRAQKYFEMFSLHYDIYGQLVPEALMGKLDKVFIDHLINLIEKRLTVKGSTQVIGEGYFFVKENRNKIVIDNMTLLARSPLSECQNLYSLIMEFDRYNNFRILPEDIQEPSAFKRRNKTRYRRHLEISTTIHPYTLHRMKELFEVSERVTKDVGYVALLNVENQYSEVIKVKTNKFTRESLTKCSLYIFPKKEQAEKYIELTLGYLEPHIRDPRQGLDFWPRFRNLIKMAYNYYEVNNITPTRKWLLSSIKDMDDYYQARETRASNKNMYNNRK